MMIATEFWMMMNIFPNVFLLSYLKRPFITSIGLNLTEITDGTRLHKTPVISMISRYMMMYLSPKLISSGAGEFRRLLT